MKNFQATRSKPFHMSIPSRKEQLKDFLTTMIVVSSLKPSACFIYIREYELDVLENTWYPTTHCYKSNTVPRVSAPTVCQMSTRTIKFALQDRYTSD